MSVRGLYAGSNQGIGQKMMFTRNKQSREGLFMSLYDGWDDRIYSNRLFSTGSKMSKKSVYYPILTHL